MKKLITKEYSSDPVQIPSIEEFVCESLQDLNLSSEIENNIALSVAEAASNSIVHGNNCDPEKTITVTIQVAEHEITIKIKDQGKGFVLDAVPDPTAPENILKDSGRGIHIMNSFMQNVEFDFTPTGTEIILKTSY